MFLKSFQIIIKVYKLLNNSLEVSVQEKYDYLVIGGGVVGSMIARWLSRYEGRVLLIEKEADLGMGVFVCQHCNCPCWLRSSPWLFESAHECAREPNVGPTRG